MTALRGALQLAAAFTLGLIVALLLVGFHRSAPRPEGNDEVGVAWRWDDCFVHKPLYGEGFHAFEEWRIPC